VYHIDDQEDEHHRHKRKAVVANPYRCMVGCSTCGLVCPTQAITFPGRDVVWKVERENKIFKLVHKEAADKRVKQDIQKAQAAAEAQTAQVTTRVQVEIAGEFGEKAFLAQLQQIVDGEPFDLMELTLKVPTVQGSREKTPSFMTFQVTSTEYEDVSAFVAKIRELVQKNGLVWVSDAKL
jgi:ferredoxin